MKLQQLIWLLLFASLACSKKNPVEPVKTTSTVQLIAELKTNNLQLSKPSDSQKILKAMVTVTGTDMSPVTLELTIIENKYTATFEVPKGASRVFKVESTDGANIVQQSGSATRDLNNDIEYITVTLAWITPPPVTVTISNITATSVDVSWTASTEPDFAFYRVLLDTSQPLSANDDGKKDITNQNSTRLKITGLNFSTKYYLAVVVVDTEMRYNENTTAKEFTTAADQFTIPPGRP